MTTRYTPLDEGYSWVVLLSAFLLNLLMNAGAGGMGVFLVELMHHFDAKKSVILWIGGILVSVGFLLSFLIGWLIKRFGCRIVGCTSSLMACISLVLASYAKTVTHLYITYGFMLGTFSATYFNISNIVVQQFFEKRRTLAQGTLMAGLSAGLFIWPPLTRYLMDIYGWRGAIFLHGGIQLHGIVLCALIRPVHRPEEEYDISDESVPKEVRLDKSLNGKQNGAKPCIEMDDRSQALLKETENLTDTDMDGRVQNQNQINGKEKGYKPTVTGKTKHSACILGAKCFRAMFKVTIIFPHFVLYILAVIFVQTGNVMPYTLTPARADALGLDKRLGALLVSVSAAISGVCRVLCGFLGDRPWVNRLVICGISGIVGGVLTAVSVVPTTFPGLVIIFGIIAVPSASFMSTFGSAAVDIVGKKYIQQGVGLMSVAFGLAQLTTFLVTGWLSDVLGDPKYGFLVFGIVETIGGFVFLAAYLANKRFNKHVVTIPPPGDQDTN